MRMLTGVNVEEVLPMLDTPNAGEISELYLSREETITSLASSSSRTPDTTRTQTPDTRTPGTTRTPSTTRTPDTTQTQS